MLQIPLVVAVEALSTNTSQTPNEPGYVTAKQMAIRNARKNFAVGLKNGYHQLIHSLAVEYNNTSVVQLTPYLNHYVTYKLLTTLSESDIEKFGSSIGFYPDSWESHDYDATNSASPAGKGSINNKNMPAQGACPIYGTTAFSGRTSGYNKGFSERTFKCTGQDATTYTSSTVLNEQNLKDLARNYYKSQATADVDAFFVLAQIRLKDIADFFDKLPLTRGAYLRLLINTNTVEHKINYIVTTGSASDKSMVVTHVNCASTTVVGGSSPLMVASGEGFSSAAQSTQNNFDAKLQLPQGGSWWNQLTNVTGATTGVTTPLTTNGVVGGTALTASTRYAFQMSVRANIAKDSVYSSIAHTFQNCRLYVPLYTMTNEEVSRYLTLQPTKNIVYRDVFQYQIDVAGGQPFNNLLTNGISNPKALIVIPYIQSASNPTFLGGTNIGGTGADLTTAAGTLAQPIAPWQSPFASEPGTTSPYVGVRDYNVQLAGVNIYTSNTLYDFEAFRNELARINGINGGVVDGLMSGLIGQEQFAVNNRYYITDLSRRIKAEDAVPKSIQISGTNASQVPITLFVFLEFERNISVALDSGMLLG